MSITRVAGAQTGVDGVTYRNIDMGTVVTDELLVFSVFTILSSVASNPWGGTELAKQSGTATIETPAIAAGSAQNFEFYDAPNYYVQTGIWSARVTTGGTLVLRFTESESMSIAMYGHRLSTTTSWGDNAARVEDASTDGEENAVVTTTMQTGSMTAAGDAFGVAVVAALNDPTPTITETSWTEVRAAGSHSMTYVEITGGDTEEATWTHTPLAIGWAASGALFKAEPITRFPYESIKMQRRQMKVLLTR